MSGRSLSPSAAACRRQVAARPATIAVIVTAIAAAVVSGCATAPTSPTAPAPGAPPVGAPGTPGPAGGPPPPGTAPIPLPPLPGVSPPPAPEAPSLGLFSSIKVPEGHDPVLQLIAHGAQVFRCEPRDGGGFAWTFRQPDAELDDSRGQPIGRHGPNFSFEHADGSRLLGRVVAHDAAPKDAALPWLLIATESFGDGQFKGVDYVQRINTVGGLPPPKCQANQEQQVLRVDFSADFVFYRPH